MRIIIMPDTPNDKNGYGFVVKQDLNFLNLQSNDILIFYSYEKPKNFNQSYLFLKRFGKYSYKRFVNLFSLRITGTPLKKGLIKLLRKVNVNDIESIYCGDTYFYIPLREIYPEKRIVVRFHNCFSRIKIRDNIFNYPISKIFKLNLFLWYRLENRIFSDRLAVPDFLLKEDQNYFTSILKNKESTLRELYFSCPDFRNKEIVKKISNRLIWFGGVDIHKEKSIEYFIENILPKIVLKNPNIEFHLYGRGTKKFDKRHKKIYGHGYYNQEGFPFKGDGIFINPDLIGGGIKIKLSTYFENQLPFISTPFGYDGYDYKLLKTNFFEVKEFSDWEVTINKMLNNN